MKKKIVSPIDRALLLCDRKDKRQEMKNYNSKREDLEEEDQDAIRNSRNEKRKIITTGWYRWKGNQIPNL